MIDLTPLEVRKKKGDFKRAMRGYEPGLVDDFLELVADRLEDVVRANLGHEDRIRQLEQQLRDYKERERALTDALVSAQELREEMREQAVRDAEAARREAEQEAEQIRANVAQDIEREEQSLRRLRARQAQLAQSYRALLEREMEELDAMVGGISYRAGLDEELDTPRREPAPRREMAARADSVRIEDDDEQLDDPDVAADNRREERRSPDVARDERVSSAPYAREGETRAVREVPPAYGAPVAPASAAPAPPAMPESALRPHDAGDGEDVDDATLERSLEALQVVFARDAADVRRDWPVTAGQRGAAEPAGDQGGDDAVPVAVAKDSVYDDELLLEDAIEEEEVADDAEPPGTAAIDPWLPKLIEEAP